MNLKICSCLPWLSIGVSVLKNGEKYKKNIRDLRISLFLGLNCCLITALY